MQSQSHSSLSNELDWQRLSKPSFLYTFSFLFNCSMKPWTCPKSCQVSTFLWLPQMCPCVRASAPTILPTSQQQWGWPQIPVCCRAPLKPEIQACSNQRPPPLLVFTSKGKTERGLQLWGSRGREGRLAPSTGNLWTGGLSERYRRSRSQQCSSYEILTVVFWDHFSRGLNSYLLYRISLLTVL